MRMFMLAGSVVQVLVLGACVNETAPLPDCQTTERSVALDEETAAGPADQLVAALNSRTEPLEVTYQPRRDYLEGFTDALSLSFAPSSAKWVEPGNYGPGLFSLCPDSEQLQVDGVLTLTSTGGLDLEREAVIVATEPGIRNASLGFARDDEKRTPMLLPLVDLPNVYATRLSDISCINGATPEAVWFSFGGPKGSPLGVRHSVSLSSDCGMSLYDGWTEPW